MPHLLITLYDERGKVLWVDDHYLPAAIRPQRIEPFTVALTAREQLQEITIPAEIYTNSLQDQVELDPIRSDFIPIPGNHAYHFLRVSVNYFVEE